MLPVISEVYIFFKGKIILLIKICNRLINSTYKLLKTIKK